VSAAYLHRDDGMAIELADKAGWIVPPFFERIDSATGTTFRRMVIGFVIRKPDDATPLGFVLLVPSVDGTDHEIIAENGWRLFGARDLFRAIFSSMKQERVTVRVLASNVRNIRVLEKFGFRIEGRKRLASGDIISMGMLREECRFLKENDHGRA
jgi:RimJ/RimL family protein N-acetyltransferase